MKRALTQARKGHGNTGPNPLVGALVVRDGQVVASGYHARVGEAHAEVVALKAAGTEARGADLVVTLEPCSHHGRTPPCVDLIVQSGIRRVVVGALDPNPRERGRGIALLRERKIEVLVPVEDEACRKLNEPYFKYITSGLPFVTAKLACSLDGRIATATGDSKWFTSPPSLRYVHRMRRDSDAVMVGGGTASSDDPALTVRLARPVTHPLRVVVSSRLELPVSLKLFAMQDRDPTVVFTTEERNPETQQRLVDQGVEVIVVGARGGRPDLADVLRSLGELSVSRLFVDGGGKLAGSLVNEHLVDRLVLAYAPLLVGSRGMPSLDFPGVDRLADARRHRVERVERSGDDFIATVRLGPEFWRGVP